MIPKKIFHYLLKNWPYILSFIIFLAVYKRVFPFSDDIFYGSILERFQGNKFATLVDYYYNWGGKLVPELVWLNLLGKDFWFYRIISSLLWAILIYATYLFIDDRDTSQKQNNYIILLVLAMFFLIPYKTFLLGSLWASGSIVYFYSAVSLVVALLPIKCYFFDKKDIMTWKYLIFFPVAFYASYSEQTALILSGFAIGGLAYKIYKKEKVHSVVLIYLVFILINSVFGLTAPGNAIRRAGEFVWFTNFDMLNLIDKFLLGASTAMNHIYRITNFIIIVSILIFYNLWSKPKREKTLIILSVIPICYAVFGRIFLSNSFFAVPEFSATLILGSYIGLITGAGIFLFLAYLIFQSFDNVKKGLFFTSLFLFSFLSTVALGFSPTVYASGPRTFFIIDLFLSIISLALFREVYTKKWKSIFLKMAWLAICLLAFITIWRYIFMIDLPRA